MPHPADRRAAERRLFRPGPSGPLSVCLVYPNTYAVGMANLGFQAVLRILAEDPRVTADRAFLPDGPRAEWPRTLRSLERDRPLGDFDVVAFCLSFEADYAHVLDCLGLAGIPLWRRERGADGPLVIAGGPATFLNPEPLAEFVDLFLIGEAEDMLGEFLARATAEPFRREGVLERSEEVRGAYRPDRYTPEYDAAGDLVAFPYQGPGSGRVERRFVADLDRFDTNSEVLTRESVFGDMYLVEASRGCEWGCRFCAAGFMYRPVRYRSPDTLRASIVRGLAERDTIGLVGAEMASLPGGAALCQGPRPPRRQRAAARRPHPGLDQPLRAEAVDAVSVGADGGHPLAAAEARPPPPRARGHPRRRGRDREPARGVPADAPLARRPVRGRDPGPPARAPGGVVAHPESPPRERGRRSGSLRPPRLPPRCAAALGLRRALGRQALPPRGTPQGVRRAADAALRHRHLPHLRRVLRSR